MRRLKFWWITPKNSSFSCFCVFLPNSSCKIKGELLDPSCAGKYGHSFSALASEFMFSLVHFNHVQSLLLASRNCIIENPWQFLLNMFYYHAWIVGMQPQYISWEPQYSLEPVIPLRVKIQFPRLWASTFLQPKPHPSHPKTIIKKKVYTNLCYFIQLRLDVELSISVTD